MPKINQEEYEKIKLLPDYDWNWIAREKTGKILSFTNKPTKTDEVWKGRQTRLWFNYKDSQLFQFIQWEDEEPHNIAELIEEYEENLANEIINRQFESLFGESEETEVKKDLDWAKNRIKNTLKFEALDDREVGFKTAIQEALEILDQLDEPEVTELDALNRLAENVQFSAHEIASHLEKLSAYNGKVTYGDQEILVPKQELPVVPTWFDEWWKDVTKGGGSLFHNIERFYDELFSSGTREMYNYISDPDNKKKLLNIIINELEYEVEEEPQYIIKTGGERYLSQLSLNYVNNPPLTTVHHMKEMAIRFSDRELAHKVADLVNNGEVEELEE